MKILKILLSSFLFISCATNPDKELAGKINIQNEVQYYDFKDLTGDYQVKKENKFSDKKLFSRKILFSSNKSEYEPLEKTVTVSQIGSVKIKNQNYPIMRPFASQHTVWLDKKKYFVETKVDFTKKKLIIRMESPKEKWNGEKSYNFPNSNTFCFYSQLIECVDRTGFIVASSKVKKGIMPLYIIWDNYPYNQEQYANMPEEIFTSAKFSYLEKEKDGHKFSLETDQHEIFYHFDDSLNFTKMFWVAQGISQLRK